MQNSILKNLSYNVILQFILMVLPLVSIPYVSRVLGAEGIGTYSFTLSVAQYFIIVGTMGLALYGNRQIAYTRKDPELMSKTFWSIFIIRLFTVSFTLIVYYLIFINKSELRFYHLFQSIHIIASIFEITWLFVGLENFKSIVYRNLSVKLIGLVAIFVFVNNKEDVILYTVINVLMSVASSLIMWVKVPHLLVKVKITFEDIKGHIQPSLKLFIPQLASQVYVLLDKTMLGYLGSIVAVGYYTQGERIVRAILELTNSLGVVMLPRMSFIFASGDVSKMKQYLNFNLSAVSYIAWPMAIGIMTISNTFVPVFFGNGYTEVITIMRLLSMLLVFISLSSVLGVQYLLPANRVNSFTFSIVLGALVNLICNFILIPILDATGAAIGTFLAEASVMISQMIFLRKEIDLFRFIKNSSKYIFASFLMGCSVYFFNIKSLPDILLILSKVSIGIVVYFGVLSLVKDEVNKSVINQILKVLKLNRS